MRFAITSGVCPERLLGEAEAGLGRGGWLGVGREDGPSRWGGAAGVRAGRVQHMGGDENPRAPGVWKGVQGSWEVSPVSSSPLPHP